jgi:HPt (histidine-containing phosphotransfer) domain-containing protein
VNGLDPRFEALRQRFLARCVEDLVVIKAAIEQPQAADREALRTTVHRLAGAAGTFGYGELGRMAGEADDALMVDDGKVTRELERLAEALRTTLS